MRLIRESVEGVLRVRTVTSADYRKVLDDVGQLEERGERLRAYWEVGWILDGHLQRALGDSGYGTRLMSQLGDDLKMDPRRLYNMVEVSGVRKIEYVFNFNF